MSLFNRDSHAAFRRRHAIRIVELRAYATHLVQDSEIDLPVRVPLFRGEPKEPGGFAIVLRQSTPACQIADSKIVLPACVPLVRGELEEAGSLAIVLRQAAATLRIEKPKTNLRSPIELNAAIATAACSRRRPRPSACAPNSRTGSPSAGRYRPPRKPLPNNRRDARPIHHGGSTMSRLKAR